MGTGGEGGRRMRWTAKTGQVWRKDKGREEEKEERKRGKREISTATETQWLKVSHLRMGLQVQLREGVCD